VHLRGFIPVVVLGIISSIGAKVYAVNATDYTALRGKVTITTLASTDQLATQFPGHVGQVIEVEGIINGIFTSNGSTGFLLQLDATQTLIFTGAPEDQDIAIANKLRVLGRIPSAGTVLNAVSFTRLNPIIATSVQNSTATQALSLTSMPIEHRPPVYFYQGEHTDNTKLPVQSASGIVQRQEMQKRYAQKIKSINGHITDNTATAIAFHILEKSERYNVDPRLTMVVLAHESRFNPNAVSRTGARGLGQLMPGTAEALGVHNAFDIEENIDGSVRYLRTQLQTFGNITLALAAYNAGPNNVKRYGGVPPFRETQNYVQAIWTKYTDISSEMIN